MNYTQIKELREIKKSIIASPAVKDTIWMIEGNCTACEAIDHILIENGEDPNFLEKDYTPNQKSTKLK